jgi:hypothetical protein
VAVADSGAFETSDGGLTWLRLGSPVGPEVETGAWDPLSGTVYLAPFARSIVAGTFGSQPLAAGVDAAFLPAARTVQLTAWVHGGAPLTRSFGTFRTAPARPLATPWSTSFRTVAHSPST